MFNKISVTVIVCTWNRSQLLKKTLESLTRQIVSPENNFEVIVVDNNSNDDTQYVVETFSKHQPNIQIIYRFEPTQGKQFALNNGISSARGEIIAFTDDDIILPSNWINNIIQAFSDKSLELCGGKTEVSWPKAAPPDWYDYSMSAVVGAIDLGSNRISPPPLGYAPAGANLIARKSIFEKIGLFSTDHYRHMDQEFGERCARHGIKIAYEPEIVVFAPIDQKCLTKKYFRRWAFKSGFPIGEENLNARCLSKFFIPKWMILQLMKDTARLIGFSRNSFSAEFRIFRNLGFILGTWRKAISPHSYDKWVKHWSQKKNDTY